jgi:hypothetical protein
VTVRTVVSYTFGTHDEVEEHLLEEGLPASWGTWSCLRDIDGTACYCISPEEQHVVEMLPPGVVLWIGIAGTERSWTSI